VSLTVMSRTIRHWTPRYLVNRLFWELYQRRNPSVPWLTKEACDFLSDWLKPNHVGIEWGSGRSTLWFAQRVEKLISIEHDAAWFERVETQLKEHGIKNVAYHFASLDQKSENQSHRYAEIGAELPLGSLDFALVDGQLRDLCCEAVIDKLKPGGLLVLDNSEQYIRHPSHSPAAIYHKRVALSDRWSALNERLVAWECTWTSSGVCDTALFTKPLES